MTISAGLCVYQNKYTPKVVWDLKHWTQVWNTKNNWCTAGVHKIPGARSPWATTLCTVAPNICGPSAWNLIHVTLPSPRILRWLLDFCNICATLLYFIIVCIQPTMYKLPGDVHAYSDNPLSVRSRIQNKSGYINCLINWFTDCCCILTVIITLLYSLAPLKIAQYRAGENVGMDLINKLTAPH
jgi:hypothetical protein